MIPALRIDSERKAFGKAFVELLQKITTLKKINDNYIKDRKSETSLKFK